MIGEAFAGRRVVLTGATGFLGKVWLALLLHRLPSIGQVVVLVRGGREGAKRRFERIVDTSPCFRPLREAHGSGLGRWLGERLTIVEADLAREGCGLDGEGRAAVGAADLFVNCAGLTDFSPDPKKALAVNVDGALRLAELAEAAGAPFLHVSTCYTAGCRGGRVEETITVGRAPNGTWFDPRAALEEARRAIHRPRLQDRIQRGEERARALGWPNIYTWSKGLAEQLLAGRPELRLTVARPSIVECARRFPFAGWNEGINTAGPLAWLISTAFRRLPANPEHRFDVVPVDDVARGLLLLGAAALRGEAPPVSQLATGDVNPLTFGRTIELTGLALRRHVRKGGGTDLEKYWFRHLDPVPGDGGWILPLNLRRYLPPLLEGVGRLRREERLPERLRQRLEVVESQVRRLKLDVEQVEEMLALYRPFIEEHDWCFVTETIRSLSAALPPEEADLAYDVESICWREYWIDIEYPGLMTYCVPLLRGGKAPTDRPSEPPLRIERMARAASK